MIDHVYLTHFKCFEEVRLPLAPLTLLSGLNASGKSTIIQSLTLFHQTLNENPGSKGLILNGKDITLGSSEEVIDKITGRNSFRIGFAQDDLNAIWTFNAYKGESEALIAPIHSLEWSNTDTTYQRDLNEPIYQLLPLDLQGYNQALKQLLNTLQTLTYISADRIGPREIYPASSSIQQTGVGARGEFTPWFIEQFQDLAIPQFMCIPDQPATLKRQAAAWLNVFFPGSDFDTRPVDFTNLYTFRLRTNTATSYHRPTNVGYGLSHVLPVIVAALGAVGFAQSEQRSAPLLLVENPELHLHPAGQSAMGVFLARAAAAGAQVIIETHSDHVLNGIRKAVKGVDNEKILAPEQVAIHFFQPRDLEGNRPQVISPQIDKNGTLDSWPEGFFDQIDKDTAALIDW